jgi:hypothetical protein
VVLVTTLGEDGVANVAPKSWVSMAAFGPQPVLMFGCTLEHATARNSVSLSRHGGRLSNQTIGARDADLRTTVSFQLPDPRAPFS